MYLFLAKNFLFLHLPNLPPPKNTYVKDQTWRALWKSITLKRITFRWTNSKWLRKHMDWIPTETLYMDFIFNVFNRGHVAIYLKKKVISPSSWLHRVLGSSRALAQQPRVSGPTQLLTQLCLANHWNALPRYLHRGHWGPLQCQEQNWGDLPKITQNQEWSSAFWSPIKGFLQHSVLCCFYE